VDPTPALLHPQGAPLGLQGAGKFGQMGAAPRRSKSGGCCDPGKFLAYTGPQLTSDSSVFWGSLSAMGAGRTTCLQCETAQGVM
jgi:hypothetical protein